MSGTISENIGESILGYYSVIEGLSFSPGWSGSISGTPENRQCSLKCITYKPQSK
jgi:hypothetical protein